MRASLPLSIVKSVRPVDASPRSIAREFRRLLAEGVALRPAGRARRRPRQLLSRGYTPKHRVDLFDTSFYLSGVRQNKLIRFFVAYVVPGGPRGAARAAWPRIFYKDLSLVWRSASHLGTIGGEIWIGKGAVTTMVVDGEERLYSVESTTDLPVEMQAALEGLIRLPRRIPGDEAALELVLRRGPEGRIEPYRDFVAPRERARSDPRNRVNAGRAVAWFARRNDPTSLRFAPGFEPDFGRGVLEVDRLKSRLYGGRVRRYRILSRNRRIQYLFMAGPRQVWIVPPQTTTTELSTYGLRTLDVAVDEDLCIPGYEYHYWDEDRDPPGFYSQIPPGYAGAPSAMDELRADASPWLERLPVVREFRRRVLRSGRRAR